MALLYPRPVTACYGVWFTLENDITLLKYSGRFVGYSIDTGELVLANGPNVKEIIGWLDMPNDARVYQMENAYESMNNPDYTYKAGDQVFLINSIQTRFLIPAGSVADLKVGMSYSLTIDSDGNQVLGPPTQLPSYVVLDKVEADNYVMVHLLTTHY